MSQVTYKKVGHVAQVTLNRSERLNALTSEMMIRLADAWDDVLRDDSIRVAIITGAGTKSFCVGADLERYIPLATRAREPQDDWDRRMVQDWSIQYAAVLRREDFTKPIIAAVNGYCFAGGMDILLGTDIRLATPNATFGLAEVKRGVIAGGGSMARLARQIPYCHAMELLLTGEAISAEEACRIGLVNRVVEQDDLLSAAQQIALRIAENGPLAVRATKEVVTKTSGIPLAEAFDIETRSGANVFRSSDAKEGPLAFVEKRKPVFTGE